ncbi:MAG: DUF3267 domain-containing protein [Bacilli bacterium]|nr:DUF3267 domain-containing protein [Bacilli bacterium]
MSKKYYIYQMNVKFLNIFSIIFYFLIIFITFLIDRNFLLESFYIDNYFWFILMLLLYTCLHEILHSIAYVLHGANFKNITYGMAFEKGICYCLCKQNISKKNILISLLYPFIFIGVLTYIISIIYHLPMLLFLSICNIGGCTGDIIMFFFILKIKNIQFSEFDDETSFALYTDEDLSSKKFFGLNYLGCKDNLDIKDYKKINVSRGSFILLFFLFAFGLVSFMVK